jgi:diguanylate cyclase (GGDEF)-like protein
MKDFIREVQIKVVVTVVAAAILALITPLRNWMWNLGKSTLVLPVWLLLLLAVVFLVIGGAVIFILLRKALKHGRLDAMTNTLRADQIDGFLTKRLAEATSKKLKFAVLLVDIDNFKSINDEYNHEIGNHTLAEIAGIIRPRSPGEEIFRYGGDEFLIVAKLSMDNRSCWGYAKRIVSDVSQWNFLGEVNNSRSIKLTVSCGCVLAGPGDTVDGIRKQVVDALKLAKRPTEANPAGKNAAFLAGGNQNGQPES